MELFSRRFFSIFLFCLIYRSIDLEFVFKFCKSSSILGLYKILLEAGCKMEGEFEGVGIEREKVVLDKLL